jgi:hypothetical protein
MPPNGSRPRVKLVPLGGCTATTSSNLPNEPGVNS